MRNSIYFLLVITGILLVFHCENPDFIIGGVEYFPNSEGYFIEYSDQSGEADDIKLKIENEYNHGYFGQVNEYVRYVWDSDENHYVEDEINYLKVDAGGAYTIDDIESEYRFPLLRFPLSIGKIWEWGYDVSGESYAMTAKIQGQEEVMTPYGNFPDCIKVEYIFPDSGQTAIIWYCEGVGIVRRYIVDSLDYRLTNFGTEEVIKN
jgi:hypothetical protein